MQKVIGFIFHIYAPNTCSLHFCTQVSYRFSMLISLAEQELKTQQPQLVGDSRGVTTRNYKEPTKKITRSRKDDTNTKKKPACRLLFLLPLPFLLLVFLIRCHVIPYPFTTPQPISLESVAGFCLLWISLDQSLRWVMILEYLWTQGLPMTSSTHFGVELKLSLVTFDFEIFDSENGLLFRF